MGIHMKQHAIYFGSKWLGEETFEDLIATECVVLRCYYWTNREKRKRGSKPQHQFSRGSKQTIGHDGRFMRRKFYPTKQKKHMNASIVACIDRCVPYVPFSVHTTTH